MDIVIFDVGKTLVRGTHKNIVLFLYKKGRVSLFFLVEVYFLFLLHKIGLVKDEDVNKISIKLFNSMVINWHTEDAQKILRDCFEKVIKQKIIPQSVEIIRSHIKKGDVVILISAFLGGVIENLKNYLNLKYAIYPRLEIYNNRFTGRILGPFPYGKDKVGLVRELIDKEHLSFKEIYAYADRFSDHFLLESVDNPHVINPDIKLHKLALEKGWKIHVFNK
jgi:HAD superfamily hydrolase (TIGR01490 family)